MLLFPLIYLINYLRGIKENIYTLYFISIGDSKVKIEFFNKDELVKVEDNIEFFSFSDTYGSQIVRNPILYLKIKYKGDTILKQFAGELWSKNEIKEPVENFRKINLSTH